MARHAGDTSFAKHQRNRDFIDDCEMVRFTRFVRFLIDHEIIILLSNQVRVIFDVSFIRLVASKYLDISHVPSLEAWSDKTRVEKWPGCCNEMRFN